MTHTANGTAEAINDARPADAGVPQDAGACCGGGCGTGKEAGATTGARPDGAGAGAPAEDAATLRRQRDELAAKLDALQRERDDVMIRFRRQATDFDAYMKRTRGEIDAARRGGLTDVIKAVLPVMDDLDRAAATPAVKSSEDPLARGVRMTLEKFAGAMKRFGVEPIASVGTAFDPSVHEVVAVEATDRAAEGTVLEEFRRGWMHEGRAVRTAQVKTAREPDPAPGAAQ